MGRRTQQNIYRLDRDEEVLFPVLPDLGELDEWVEEDIQRLLEEPAKQEEDDSVFLLTEVLIQPEPVPPPIITEEDGGDKKTRLIFILVMSLVGFFMLSYSYWQNEVAPETSFVEWDSWDVKIDAQDYMGGCSRTPILVSEVVSKKFDPGLASWVIVISVENEGEGDGAGAEQMQTCICGVPFKEGGGRDFSKFVDCIPESW